MLCIGTLRRAKRIVQVARKPDAAQAQLLRTGDVARQRLIMRRFGPFHRIIFMVTVGGIARQLAFSRSSTKVGRLYFMARMSVVSQIL